MAWFTVEQIDPETFAISEYSHWEETHCYLLNGSERSVLIDTGLGVDSLRAVVERLTCRPVTVVTTHAHWDHIGGHSQFQNILIHEEEREWLSGSFPLSEEIVRRNLTKEPCRFPAEFHPADYRIYRGGASGTVRDGERIELGGRSLTVLHTPGHSPGHVCLWEPERRYLYTGDLLYAGCLDAFYPSTDPEAFWRSVKRVRELPVRKLLPGHHSLDLPVDLASEVDRGFAQISAAGRLKQGSGLFSFADFQIHL